MILDTYYFLYYPALVILLRFQSHEVTMLLPLSSLKASLSSTKAPRCTAMANFLFPCIALLLELALLYSRQAYVGMLGDVSDGGNWKAIPCHFWFN